MAAKMVFNEKECVVKKDRYVNGRAKIDLHDSVSGVPITTATINIPEFPLEDDEVIIKNYFENKGMVDALVEHRIAKRTGRICVHQYVVAPIVKILI